jgi:hypothetical protein
MSRGSLFFVRTVDVVYTDVVGNASPPLAFLTKPYDARDVHE